jgi:multicomponent Na+:H+ antiporter subunit D
MINSPIFYLVLTYLPATLGFLGCIKPKIIFPVAMLTLLGISGISLEAIFSGFETSYKLMWTGGIEFSFDQYTFPLLLGASLSLLIVLSLYRDKLSHYFYQICLVLLTALTVSFSAQDLISIYIALELTGFCAFILIADRNDNKSLFHSFQYLIGGGLAMLIYLIGVVQGFQFSGTFLISDLSTATTPALCLIVAGLLTKAGIFICGLWVPNIYSHANRQTAAILSGCVTCAGVAPIARLSVSMEPIGNSMVVIGVLSGIIAALYAVFERDDGRALGWSSVSQLGLAILSPSYACIYAMQHGLCKTLLFATLSSPDKKSSKQCSEQESPTNVPEWLLVTIFIVASLSIMGLPFTTGFITKTWLKGDIPLEASLITSTSTLLTATVYTRLIWTRVSLYKRNLGTKLHRELEIGNTFNTQTIILLISGVSIIAFSITYPAAYYYENIQNSLTAIILASFLYTSVAGLQTENFVKPVTKTLDLVGAPFVVAALLLANLFYFKI